MAEELGGKRVVGGRGRGQGKGRGRGRGPPGAAPEPGAGARKATGSRWSLASLVHRQAADALARLLAASASRRGGTSIKALTLAPHIQAKKATYAVTHETLRYLPVLKGIVEDVGLLQECRRVSPEGAYVLTYELLFGQGVKPTEARSEPCSRGRLR
eukprot:jgi/Tetstr1/422828/TSEL_013619.t1